MPQKTIRILQLVSSANPSSGVRSVVYNWHRNIDISKIQFDYLYVQMDNIAPQEDILSLGAKYYVLPNPYKYPVKFLQESYKFFKNHRYKTIHSHFTNLNFFFYPLAKIFGTKNIIQHAHGTKWSDKKLSSVRNYLMLHAVWLLINRKLACSQKAGEIFFGKNFEIINNGIDIGKFTYNIDTRNTKRKELGIENKFVIGHIGRFSNEKNHKFLIDILGDLVKVEPTACLLLIGNGPLEQEIKNYVKDNNLQNKVLFLGIRKDVQDLYQAFDVFCLPSLHEGMPVVAVEAQCSGLPCVFSDTITKEVLILPDSKMLSINNYKMWVDQILALKNIKRQSGVQYLKAKGFDIKDVAKKMEEIYGSK